MGNYISEILENIFNKILIIFQIIILSIDHHWPTLQIKPGSATELLGPVQIWNSIFPVQKTPLEKLEKIVILVWSKFKQTISLSVSRINKGLQLFNVLKIILVFQRFENEVILSQVSTFTI